MIKLKSLFFLSFLILLFGCAGQRLAQNELVVADFNWKLKIPDFLISENKDEWARMQDLGRKSIENTYGVDLKNKVTTIFIFKSQDESFFEATSEPFDTKKNYISTCEMMNNVVYQTVKAQAPTARVDTIKSVVNISNIPFQTLTAKITFPTGVTRNAVIFRSLFKDKELTVSIMFSNQQTGNQIIEAFKNSSFSFDKD